MMRDMVSRVATEADVDTVTATIAAAFRGDPVWGLALARPDGGTDHLVPFWRPYVQGALRYSTVFLVDDGAAVAAWIPPGGTEMSDAQENAVQAIIDRNLEPEAQRAISELWDRFDANHPRSEPHAYLSLLATHPDHRGRGIGQMLLAENLAHFGAQGLPAYLESTNPANNHRYERAGFRSTGEFRSVLNDAPVATMWRSASG
jgi:ribosomal protein S18 acetylase RimI-like enzyme